MNHQNHLPKRLVDAPHALNQPKEYGKSFNRGVRVDLGAYSMILISGTASIDEQGRSVHDGDLKAQTQRTFYNITELLKSENASWKDVVQTRCYLKNIARDYSAFNECRNAFYREQGLDPFPASVGIQAELCRPELLVEIEATAYVSNSTAG